MLFNLLSKVFGDGVAICDVCGSNTVPGGAKLRPIDTLLVRLCWPDFVGGEVLTWSCASISPMPRTMHYNARRRTRKRKKSHPSPLVNSLISRSRWQMHGLTSFTWLVWLAVVAEHWVVLGYCRLNDSNHFVKMGSLSLRCRADKSQWWRPELLE